MVDINDIELVSRYIENPNEFVFDLWRDWFIQERGEDPKKWIDSWCIEVLQALKENQYVAVTGANAVGKTAVSCFGQFWFLCTREESLVPVTSVDQPHLRSIFWAESRRWFERSPELQKTFEHSATFIRNKEKPAIWFSEARTARKQADPGGSGKHAAGLQGFHAPHLLFIVDEGCFDDKTEILTDQGWRFFSALNGSENTLTMNPSNRLSYYTKPSKYIANSYNGLLWQYRSRTCSFSVTPNHRMFYGYRSPRSNNEFPWKLGEIQNIKSEQFFLDKHVQLAQVEEIDSVDLFGRSVSMDSWLAFLGWYMSEGSLGYQHGKPYTVVISQQGCENRNKIIECVGRLGFNPSVYPNAININSIELGMYLVQLVGEYFNGKRVPRFVFKLSSRQIHVFLNAFCLGDGYCNNGARVYYSSGKLLADDIQELILLSGGYASVSKRVLEGKKSWIKDHWAISSCDGYVVYESIADTDYLIRAKDIERVPYDGMVYCVDVPPDHLIYTRRDGKAAWFGNSAVDDVNWESAESSIRLPDQRILAISNPLRVFGRMFEIFNLEKYSVMWYTRAVSYKESSLIDPDLAAKQIAILGEDSPVAQVRYYGRFPKKGTDDTLPTYDSVERAIKRTFFENKVSVNLVIEGYRNPDVVVHSEYSLEQLLEIDVKLELAKKFEFPLFNIETLMKSEMEVVKPILIKTRWDQHQHHYFYFKARLGVDLARFGSSETSFCVRRGNRVLELLGVHGLRGPNIKGRIENYFEMYGVEACIIDATGIAGGVLTDFIDGEKYPCVEVSFGGESTNPFRFANLATEMWFAGIVENIESLLLPDDDILLSQLTTRRYTYTGKTAQQVIVESKRDMKKRLLPSPDRADALCLAFAPVEIFEEDEEGEEEHSNIEEPEEAGVFNFR